MEKDRKQIKALFYLVLPVVMLWGTTGTLLAYDVGKNSLHNINWSWILLNSLPMMMIATAMFFNGIRLQQAYIQDIKQ